MTGSSYTHKLNIVSPENKNYYYDTLSPPPVSTRATVSSAQGTPDYYNSLKY